MVCPGDSYGVKTDAVVRSVTGNSCFFRSNNIHGESSLTAIFLYFLYLKIAKGLLMCFYCHGSSSNSNTTSVFSCCHITVLLKVVTNEKLGGSGSCLVFKDGFGPWRSMSVDFLI